MKNKRMSESRTYLSRERRELYSKLWKTASSNDVPMGPPSVASCEKCGDEKCKCKGKCSEGCPCEKEIGEVEAIDYSNRVVVALEKKLEEFKKEGFEKRVTLAQLKSIFRKGWQEGNSCESAMVRVNMFLEMLKGKKEFSVTKTNFVEDLMNEVRSDLLDMSLSWKPSEECVTKGQQDVEKYDLAFKVENVEELYLEDYKKVLSYWEEN